MPFKYKAVRKETGFRYRKSWIIANLLNNLDEVLSAATEWGKVGVLYCYHSRMPERLVRKCHVMKKLPLLEDIKALKKQFGYESVVLVLDDMLVELQAMRANTEQSLDLSRLFVDMTRTLRTGIICTFVFSRFGFSSHACKMGL